MKVFFTQQGALRAGEQFDSQLVDALDNSLVVVPIVSASALDRMIAQPVDYLLLEWQVALILAESKDVGDTKLAILPIVVPGVRSLDDERGDEPAGATFGKEDACEHFLGQLEAHALDDVPTGTARRTLELLRRQYPGATLPLSAEGWRRTARQTVHSLLHGVQRPEVLHGGPATAAAPREWDLVEAAAQSVFKIVSGRAKEEPWHKEKNAAGVRDAVHAHSKALAKSSGALSAEEERKILSDARLAVGHHSFTISLGDLKSFSEKYDSFEFKPPSKHFTLEPVLAVFTLLRDRLSKRAADHLQQQHLSEPPKLFPDERDIFRLCECFTKAFLLAYVRFCTEGRNAGLRKLMHTDSEAKKRQYAGTYQAQVKDNISTEAGYQNAIVAASALQALPGAKLPAAPLDLSVFMSKAAMAQERVGSMIQRFVEGNDGTTPLIGKLKVAYRVIEKALKSMSGPLEELHEQWSYEKANDCARGGIECDDMKQCAACLEWFAGLQKAGTIRLLKVKDRYTDPTDGGWSDFLIMFLFPGGAGQHIPCEIQIMHTKLLAARKGMEAHAAYDGFRAACETLALLRRLGPLAPPGHAAITGERGGEDLAKPAQGTLGAAVESVSGSTRRELRGIGDTGSVATPASSLGGAGVPHLARVMSSATLFKGELSHKLLFGRWPAAFFQLTRGEEGLIELASYSAEGGKCQDIWQVLEVKDIKDRPKKQSNRFNVSVANGGKEGAFSAPTADDKKSWLHAITSCGIPMCK
jgi:hypothetical protein